EPPDRQPSDDSEDSDEFDTTEVPAPAKKHTVFVKRQNSDGQDPPMDRQTSIRSEDSADLNEFEKSKDTFDLPLPAKSKEPKKKVFRRVIINDGHIRKDPIILPSVPEDNMTPPQPKMSIDMPPGLDNYRKETHAGGRTAKTRPSIYDLMEGGAIERKQMDNIYTMTLKEEYEKNCAEKKKDTGVKFGWIEGV
ncbi:hypothetical protein PENTCL1PPCAC_10814, partial [Pristionchus entomophagus]